MVAEEFEPVGFIGLGDIGGPMCRNLVDWPGGLTVCDVREESTARFAAKGASVAANPAEVATAATCIMIMVNTEAQVRDVLAGPEGILSTARPGTVVAIHSTIGPDAAVELAALAAGSGVDLVDAPVSGGAGGARSGQLAVMVGGTEEAAERCRPVFERFAAKVVHMGGTGAGIKTKVARNLITFASYALVGEAQRLAEASGLDLVKLGDVVRHSDQITGGPGAIMIRPTAAPLADDDGLRPIFQHSSNLGSKDLELAIAMGRATGVDVPFAELALELLPRALGLDADG